MLCVTLALCIVASFACVACGKKGGKGSLKLDQESVQLYVNEENALLRATLEPADKSAKYEWSVDATGIVELAPAQSRCTVKPIAEGTATVTVTSGKYKATCAVTVDADRHERLAAPSFTYDETTGVITITDAANDASKVGGYELHFYQNGEDKGSVAVTSGEAVNTRRIDKGEYVARLIAVGSGNLYLPSDPSESTANITVTVDAEYDLYDSKAILEGENRWGYYVGQWAVYVGGTFYDDRVTFEFNNNEVTTKDYWWMTQLQYNYGHVEEGKLYKMTLGINSPASGKVTINNKEVMLKVGMNEVTVGLSSAVNNGMLKMTFAVADGSSYIKEGKFVIDVGEVTETTSQKLVTPSFEFDRETKIITITDEDNSPYDVNYTLGFFNTPTDEAPAGTAVVTSGAEVDFGSILSGTYYLRLMAASTGMPYENSDWTDVTDYSIDVSNARVDLPSGGQGVSATNPNKWYEWHDANGNGGSGTATALDYAYQNDTGMIYVRYTVAGSTPQPLKLHYNDSAIAEGDVYEFNCVVISPMDGKITVNGQIFEVRAHEETEIKVVRRQPNKTNGGGMRTTLTIQFGASETVDGADAPTVYTLTCEGEEDQIIVKDLEWHKVETTALAAPTAFTFDKDTDTVTAVTDGNAAGKVSGYVLGLFETETDAEPLKTLPVTVGEAIDLSTVTAGEYCLRIKAVAAALPDVDSPWSAALSDKLVIVGDADIWNTIAYTGNAGATGNKGEWSKYVDTVTAEYAEYNGLGDVRIKYTGTPKNDQPFKLMKVWANIASGDVYTTALTLVVPEGTFGGATSHFSVNDQVFEISEGENEITLSNKLPSNNVTLTIKFGAIVGGVKVGLPAGEYLVKDITVTKVTPEQLAAPTFTYDADAKTLAITDTNDAAKVKRYELGLFVEGSETAAKTITVEDGVAIDFAASGVAAGTYTLKLRAAASSVLYIDSAWYAPDTAVTVTVEAAA